MRSRQFVTLLEPTLTPFRFAPEFRELETLITESENYVEADGHFLTSMDMPGVNAKDIEITVEDGQLMISAERKKLFDKRGEQTLKYSRNFAIPKNTDVDNIDAHYENGVLTIAFPKLEESKYKKRINVVSGEKPKKWQNFLSFGKSEKEIVN